MIVVIEGTLDVRIGDDRLLVGKDQTIRTGTLRLPR